MDNRCVCCGDIIPESRQVCAMCELKVLKSLEQQVDKKIYNVYTRRFNLKSLMKAFWNWIH